MRKTKISANFFITLFINLLLNIEGAVIGVVLLLLHFWIGISVWWSVGAFVVWILYIILFMYFMGWAADCSNTKDPVKENKNPYSVNSSTSYKDNENI